MCPGKVPNCHIMGSLPYYIVLSNGTWYDAVDFCHQHNDVLASIPPAKYNAILQTIFTIVTNLKNRSIDVWIGLRKQEFQFNTCKIYVIFHSTFTISLRKSHTYQRDKCIWISEAV